MQSEPPQQNPRRGRPAESRLADNVHGISSPVFHSTTSYFTPEVLLAVSPSSGHSHLPPVPGAGWEFFPVPEPWLSFEGWFSFLTEIQTSSVIHPLPVGTFFFFFLSFCLCYYYYFLMKQHPDIPASKQILVAGSLLVCTFVVYIKRTREHWKSWACSQNAWRAGRKMGFQWAVNTCYLPVDLFSISTSYNQSRQWSMLVLFSEILHWVPCACIAFEQPPLLWWDSFWTHS